MTTAGCVSLLHGNALSIPLADQSVHLIVTSPPYWTQRSYRDDDEHMDGQLGDEATPHRFLAALWAVMDECWRVLRDDGSAWVNLGDKHSGSGGHNNEGISAKSTLRGNGHEGGVSRTGKPNKVKATRRSAPDRYNQDTGGLRKKSRMGLPHGFARGLVDPAFRAFTERRAGVVPMGVVLRPGDYHQWICRMDVVWSKRNHMPESCTDRVQNAHEYWFHLTKSGSYFTSAEVRELHVATETGRDTSRWRSGPPNNRGLAVGRRHADGAPVSELAICPDGKMPGSVWEESSEPLVIPDWLPPHHAPFPSALPRRIIVGWSPVDGIVLDPFSGSGTAPIVAAALGRHGIGVDLSWDYHQIARWRDQDGGLRAKALGVEKPAKQVTGQGSLFDGTAA